MSCVMVGVFTVELKYSKMQDRIAVDSAHNKAGAACMCDSMKGSLPGLLLLLVPRSMIM